MELRKELSSNKSLGLGQTCRLQLPIVILLKLSIVIDKTL